LFEPDPGGISGISGLSKWPAAAKLPAMKVKEAKTKAAVAIDPVLFVATVPSRKPTPKDIADCKERPDDVIEPKAHATMDDAVRDL
jgi:hypothetical protein